MWVWFPGVTLCSQRSDLPLGDIWRHAHMSLQPTSPLNSRTGSHKLDDWRIAHSVLSEGGEVTKIW